MKKGFTLLIAILTSSLFLVIGATIFKIAYTQLTLSSIGKDSQAAFYSADTGAECALYWERKYYPGGDDGSGSAFNVGDATGEPGIPSGGTAIDYANSNRQKIVGASLPTIQCLGGPIAIASKGTITNSAFNLITGRYCASVEVLKQYTGGVVVTTVTSRGYNTCDTTNPRRVERTIQIILQ
jgi:hypothetical protein